MQLRFRTFRDDCRVISAPKKTYENQEKKAELHQRIPDMTSIRKIFLLGRGFLINLSHSAGSELAEKRVFSGNQKCLSLFWIKKLF
jgi:hypothetical protein